MNIDAAQQSPRDSQPNLQEAIVATLRDVLVEQSIQDEIQQLRGDVKRIQGDVQQIQGGIQQIQGVIQQIQKELVACNKELRHTRRLTTRAWNNDTFPSDLATFEIVPFPNLDDPTTAPHNLPPLNSTTVIRELGYHHMRAYIQGYYPDLLEAPVYRDECIKMILTAIGAYQHVPS